MASPSRRGATGGPIPDAAEELPVAPGARALRITLILLLDATLLVWGLYLIRRWATEPPALAIAGTPTEAPTPTPPPSPTPSPTPSPSPSPNPSPSRTPPPNPNPSATPTPTQSPPLPPSPSPSPSLIPPPSPSSSSGPRRASHGPDVLPPRGSSLPSKPADPGVMKNPKPSTTPTPPPVAAATPPDAPPAPPPPAYEPPPEPTPEPSPPGPEPAAEASSPDATAAEHPLAAQMTAGIRRVVDGHRPAILDCYRRAAKESAPQQPLQGRLEIHLRILPAGDADDVRVVQNQTGSEALGDCLVAVMQTWRYPAPGMEAMEFVWPFTFKGGRR